MLKHIWRIFISEEKIAPKIGATYVCSLKNFFPKKRDNYNDEKSPNLVTLLVGRLALFDTYVRGVGPPFFSLSLSSHISFSSEFRHDQERGLAKFLAAIIKIMPFLCLLWREE
jgi:hypothetical protein